MSPIKFPKTQTVIEQRQGGVLEVCDAPLPTFYEPGMVMVKITAVALNPCDYKMPSRFPSPGTLDGSDFAGTIVELGPGLTRSDLKIGDRVCGAVHASNPECPQNGAFAEFLATDEDLLLKIPTGMSWEDAAAIGGCVHSSVGYSLFGSLKVPGLPGQPTEKPVYVLVYGGATSGGTMAIQLLKAYVKPD